MALQTTYTWLSFVNAVKALIPVDAQRQNTTTIITFKIREAVAQIQRLVEFYRSGHTTSYGIDDVVSDRECSVGTLPDFCNPEDAQLVQIGDGIGQMPLRQYSWDNRDDLRAGASRVVNLQGHIAIDPKGKQFVCYPQVIEGWQLRLRWNGVKTVFADADAVPFDDDVVAAVAEYVKAYVYREVDRSPDLAADCMQNFRRKCNELHTAAVERARLSKDADSAEKDPCATFYTACAAIEPVASDEEEEVDDFFALGDLGAGGDNAQEVADLVKSMDPDFVVFLGDHTHGDGGFPLVEDNFLKYWDSFVPDNSYPVFGNHDLGDGSLDGGVYGVPIANLYPDVMALNSGKYYYTFAKNYVRIFVINSGYSDADPREPDGISSASIQAAWLQAELAAATEEWKIVCLHRSPYSSDQTYTPGVSMMRWPYKTWGADLVLSGHCHTYERLLVGQLPCIVSSLGGYSTRNFVTPTISGSQFRYNSKYGALRLLASEDRLQCVFYNVDGTVIDNVTYTK